MRTRAACALVTCGTAAVVGSSAVGARASAVLHLTGTFNGTYKVVPAVPDTGVHYVLQAKAIGADGPSTLTGVARGVGFIAKARCTADVTITPPGHHGSVHLAISSRSYFAGGSACTKGYPFAWSMTTGTGSYKGLHGKGLGTLTLNATSPKLTLVFTKPS